MPATGIFGTLDAAVQVWNRRYFDANPDPIRGNATNE